MNRTIAAPAPDWRQQYPENASVLQRDPDETCPQCGSKALVFNVHFFKENRVLDLCKPCAIRQAGGEDKVYVRKAKIGLEAIWQRNARLPQPESLKKARTARQV